jgi:methylase of polypeptide subunit release factors
MKLPKDIARILFIKHRLSQQEPLEDWRGGYEAIHGRHNSQRKVDVKALELEYSIKIKEEKDLLWLIYCLEAFYSVCLRAICVSNVCSENPKLKNLFSISFFRDLGINNYLEPNPHAWVENLNDQQLESEFDVLMYAIRKEQTNVGANGPIHALFEDIFPRSLRHSLGEYYTPFWLASYMIRELAKLETISDQQKFLDPTCGSGVFLNSIIDYLYPKFGAKSFQMVAGCDIREISVLAAKTSYCLKYLNYADHIESLTIPIWRQDILEVPPEEPSLFSPVSQESQDRYDYVVGNPPWINWEYLPKAYRNKSVRLWALYNLWQAKGMDQGFIKEDISSLITFIAGDCLLKEGGELCFILKESLFKSVKQGKGFRRFRLETSSSTLAPRRVEDLTRVKVFEGATTRATIAYFKKGAEVKFPVDYIEWARINGESKSQRTESIVSNMFTKISKLAKPSDPSCISSGWLTYEHNQETAIDNVLGTNSYTARTGIFTGGLNAVYWVNILKSSSNVCTVRNIIERAKNMVNQIDAEIEKDYLYPLVAGRDVSLWQVSYSKYIILPHTCFTKMHPIDQHMLSSTPFTMSYLNSFRRELESRKGFTSIDKHIKEQHYYALQRIGLYTFSSYKVGWKYICKEFTPFVFGHVEDPHLGKKLLMPNEKIIYVGLSKSSEAYYLCGLLSSVRYKRAIEGYMVGTQITPSILKKLSIPKFDPSNELHQVISDLCLLGHQDKHKDNILDILNEINGIVESVAA